MSGDSIPFFFHLKNIKSLLHTGQHAELLSLRSLCNYRGCFAGCQELRREIKIRRSSCPWRGLPRSLSLKRVSPHKHKALSFIPLLVSFITHQHLSLLSLFTLFLSFSQIRITYSVRRETEYHLPLYLHGPGHIMWHILDSW